MVPTATSESVSSRRRVAVAGRRATGDGDIDDSPGLPGRTWEIHYPGRKGTGSAQFPAQLSIDAGYASEANVATLPAVNVDSVIAMHRYRPDEPPDADASVRLGGRRLVPRNALDAYVERLLKEQNPAWILKE